MKFIKNKILHWNSPKIDENSAQTIFRVFGNTIRLFLTLIALCALISVAVFFILKSTDPVTKLEVDLSFQDLKLTSAKHSASGKNLIIHDDVDAEHLSKLFNDDGSFLEDKLVMTYELDGLEFIVNPFTVEVDPDLKDYIKTPVEKRNCGKILGRLHITVKNNSNKTLNKLKLRISAKKQGRSTEILSDSEQIIDWDYIVEPRKSVDKCFNSPIDSSKDLIWSVSLASYGQEFE